MEMEERKRRFVVNNNNNDDSAIYSQQQQEPRASIGKVGSVPGQNMIFQDDLQFASRSALRQKVS